MSATKPCSGWGWCRCKRKKRFRIWQLLPNSPLPKHGLGRGDLRVEARLLRRGLLDNGYGELPITSAHAVALDSLPRIHKDPFDRILIAQSMVEGITLLTADPLVAQYPAPIQKV